MIAPASELILGKVHVLDNVISTMSKASDMEVMEVLMVGAKPRNAVHIYNGNFKFLIEFKSISMEV